MADSPEEILARLTGEDPGATLVAEPDDSSQRVLDRVSGVSLKRDSLFAPLTIDQAQFMSEQIALGGPTEDPDRGLVGEAAIGLARGVAQASRGGAGVVVGVSGRVPSGTLISPIARLAQHFAQFTALGAEEFLAQVPRSEDRSFTLRRTVGDVAEAAPQFAVQLAGLLVPGGVAVRLGMFAGTAAAPAAGGQYLETLAATGDPDKAAIEGGAAGLIVGGLSYVSGFAFLAKIPGAQKFVTDAAIKVSARMVGGAVGESLEELSEAVLMEGVSAMVRDDPDLFRKVLEGDPEFWGNVFRAMIAGGILGGAAGVTVGGVDVAKRLKEISEITVLDGATIQEAHELLLAVEQQRTDEQIAKSLERVPDDAPAGKILVEDLGPQEQPGDAPDLRMVNTLSGDNIGTTVVFDPDKHEIVEKATEVEKEPTAEADDEVDAPIERPDDPETPQQTQWSPNPEDFPIFTAAGKSAADQRTTSLTEGTPSQRIQSAISDVIGVVANVQTERRIAEREITDQLNRVRGEALRTRKITKGLQDTAVKLVRAVFKGKGEVPKPLLKAVAEARTPLQFAKAMRTVGIELGKVRRRDAVDRLKTVLKKAKPERLGPDLRDAVQTLMDGLRFGKLSPKAREELEALRALVAAQPDVGLSETVQKRIEQLDKIAVQSLSAEEVTALADALETILEISSKRRKAFRRLREQEEQTLASNIALEIGTLRKGKGFVQGRARLLRTKGFRSTIGGMARNIFGLIENADLDFISEILGGGEDSTSFNTIFQDGDDAQSEGLEFFFQEQDALAGFLKDQRIELGSQELSDMSAELGGVLKPIGKALSGIGIRSAALRTDPILHDVTLKNGENLQLTSADRMGMLVALADNETFDMVVFRGVRVRWRGERIGTNRRLHLEDVRAITESMPERELAIVQFMVARMNGPMKQKMSEHSIERRQFDITKPETWAPRFRVQDTAPAPISVENLQANIHARIGIEPSITKKRGADFTSPIEFRDAFAVYNNVAWMTGMFTSMEPWMARVRRVMKNRDVRRALEGSRVQRATDGLNEIFNQVAREITGTPVDRGLIEGNFLPAVRNIPVGLMGFNPRIALYQTVSVAVAGNEMPRGYLLQAGAAAFDSSVDERMNTVSYLRWRFESSAIGIVSDVLQLSQEVLGFKGQGELPMIMIRQLDRMVIRQIFVAVELQVADMVADGGIDQNQAIGVRDRLVRRVVTRTQPVWDSLHVPVRAVEAKRKTTLKLMNMFRSQRNKLNTMASRSIMRIFRNPNRRVIQEELANLGTTLVLNSIAIATIRNLATGAAIFTAARGVTGNLTDEDREELEELPKKLAASLIRTLFGIPWLGDFIAEGLVRVLLPSQKGFDVELTPVEGLANEAIRAIGQGVKGWDEGDLRKVVDAGLDLAATVGAAEGVPLPFVKREIDNLIDELEEEDSQALRSSGR